MASNHSCPIRNIYHQVSLCALSVFYILCNNPEQHSTPKEPNTNVRILYKRSVQLLKL